MQVCKKCNFSFPHGKGEDCPECVEVMEFVNAEGKTRVCVAKMTHETNHFNEGQKVWLQYMSGDLAARVIGKYRGSGRYVSAWIKWGSSERKCPEWKWIEVDSGFAKKHEMKEEGAQVQPRSIGEMISQGLERALLVRTPHVDRILDGEKLWEMRSSTTWIRGRIGLIEVGSGLIVGEVNLSAVLAPMIPEVLLQYENYHRVSDVEKLKKWHTPWVLKDAIRYKKPIAYRHPQGAQSWVKLKKGM